MAIPITILESGTLMPDGVIFTPDELIRRVKNITEGDAQDNSRACDADFESGVLLVKFGSRWSQNGYCPKCGWAGRLEPLAGNSGHKLLCTECSYHPDVYSKEIPNFMNHLQNISFATSLRNVSTFQSGVAS